MAIRCSRCEWLGTPSQEPMPPMPDARAHPASPPCHSLDVAAHSGRPGSSPPREIGWGLQASPLPSSRGPAAMACTEGCEATRVWPVPASPSQSPSILPDAPQQLVIRRSSPVANHDHGPTLTGCHLPLQRFPWALRFWTLSLVLCDLLNSPRSSTGPKTWAAGTGCGRIVVRASGRTASGRSLRTVCHLPSFSKSCPHGLLDRADGENQSSLPHSAPDLGRWHWRLVCEDLWGRSSQKRLRSFSVMRETKVSPPCLATLTLARAGWQATSHHLTTAKFLLPCHPERRVLMAR